MKTPIKPLHTWIVVVLLHAAQTVYYRPRLPMVVAQHFGGDGRANGWATRDAFLMLSWTVLLGISVIFMLMPPVLRRIPVSLINLPNKEYWLAPERQMEWMGVLTVAFVALVLHLAIRANLAPERRLEKGPFIALLVAYLLATSWWIVRLYRRFPSSAK